MVVFLFGEEEDVDEVSLFLGLICGFLFLFVMFRVLFMLVKSSYEFGIGCVFYVSDIIKFYE